MGKDFEKFLPGHGNSGKIFSVNWLSCPGFFHRGCAGSLSGPGVAFFFVRVGRRSAEQEVGHQAEMRIFRTGHTSLPGVVMSGQEGEDGGTPALVIAGPGIDRILNRPAQPACSSAQLKISCASRTAA